MCLSVLEEAAQECMLHDEAGQEEVLASHVLQAITNTAEYGSCNVELQRSAQLQVVKDLAAAEGKPVLAAAAAQALRMAGVK